MSRMVSTTEATTDARIMMRQPAAPPSGRILALRPILTLVSPVLTSGTATQQLSQQKAEHEPTESAAADHDAAAPV